MKNKIILIGMPCSGKSTIGKYISETFNKSFIDIDSYIESKEKKKIKDIFHVNGEEYFRKVEREALIELLKSDYRIISSGGGTPMYFDNLTLMKENGIVVYIKVPIAVLIKRAKETSDRPLLLLEVEKKLTEIYESRKNTYEKADIIVQGIELEETGKEIIQLVKTYNAKKL